MKRSPSIRTVRPLTAGSLGRALVAGSLLGLVAAPVAAQAPGSAARAVTTAETDALALNEQGLAFYAAQDYGHALEKFIGAHALTSEPSLLFNIARCYEQLAQLDSALEKYRLFLATARGEPKAMARARASIATIETKRDASAVQSGSSDTRAAPEPAAAAPTNAGSNWPWLALGGSAAFVAAGVTSYALGARDHARISDLPTYGGTGAPANMTWRQAKALVDSGNSKKLVGGIGLGLGGALAASAVALFLSADRAGQQEAQLGVHPSLLRGGGGLLLAGRFQ
jgi:tetratricopeptide (TPR) repeat protein